MNYRKNGIFAVAVATALSLFMPAAPAQIEIVDIGAGYDLIDHYGFVDYQNTGNYSASFALQVYIDNESVASESRDMPIRYLVGFRCSPVKTLEFPLNMSEGNHTIVAHAQTQNISLERAYGYHAEDWWIEEDEIEEDKIIDWLPCPSGSVESSHDYPFLGVPVLKRGRKR